MPPIQQQKPIIPTYALYGEIDAEFVGNWLHCESIPARSSRFDWEIRPHRHLNLFQILNITAGAADCRIAGGIVKTDPPALIAVPPGVPHGFRFSPDVDGHVITIRAERVPALLNGLDPEVLLAGPHVLAPPKDAGLEAIVAALSREFGSSGAGRERLIEAYVTILLVQMARLASEVRPGATAEDPASRHAAQFRLLLDRHFRTQRSVGFYAGKIGISDTHLNRVCRTAFGTSALGTISRRVVLEATRDLAFTILSVKEIAHSLGFEDQAYFTRFFTRQTGLTPTEYRRRNRR